MGALGAGLPGPMDKRTLKVITSFNKLHAITVIVIIFLFGRRVRLIGFKITFLTRTVEQIVLAAQQTKHTHCLFRQWTVANCAVPPSASAGQYKTG